MRVLAALAPVLAAHVAAAVSWSNDPYDITALTPEPKGCWHPDSQRRQFTLMVMPDTQYLYDENRIHPEPMAQAFQYVMSCNKTHDDNIVFLAHLGDVTQNGLTEQFDMATKAFARLDDAGVAYSTLAGNHDIDSSTDDSRGNTPYLSTFPPSRFKKSTWREASPDGYNNVHAFTAGGREWLLLSLDWRMSNRTVSWAKGVLKRYAHVPTILTTHELVSADTGETQFSEYGEQVWSELIRDNDQIFLTLNGHFWPPGRTSRLNAAGHNVDAHITNYQNRYYGGAGMLRAYRFDLDRNTIDVSTFSPWIHELQSQQVSNTLASELASLTSDVDQFTMQVDFKARFKDLPTAASVASSTSATSSKTSTAAASAVQSAAAHKFKREAQNPVVPGTLAYWRFDGHESGRAVSNDTVIVDRSGHGNDLHYRAANGTPAEALTWSRAHHHSQAGPMSLNFTSHKKPSLSGAYFQTADNATLNGEEFEHGYTFETFFNLPNSWDPDQNAWSALLSRWGMAKEAGKSSNDTDPLEPLVTMSISNNREVQWRTYPLHQNGGSTNWGHETPFGEWWHVAVVNNGTMTKLFIEGCEVARNPDQWTPGLTTLNKPWMLGGYEYDGKLDQVFYGLVGDTRIVNRALPVAEFMLTR